MKTNFIKLRNLRSSRILSSEKRINPYLEEMMKFGNKMLKTECY